MGKSGILLVEQRDGWTVSGVGKRAPSTFIPSVDSNEVAQAVVAFSTVSSLDPQQLVIAVDSASVLFASIAENDVERIKTNQSLRYALESVLPVDAESIVADSFPRHLKPEHSELLAVAMDVVHVRSLVEALEQLQCNVQFIVPHSMLVFEQVVAERSLPFPSVSIWLPSDTNDPSQAEILVVDADRTIRNWQMMEMNADAIERSLSFITADLSSLPIVVFGTKNEVTQQITLMRDFVPSHPIDRARLSQTRAATLLAGRDEPWIDLRRDQLAASDRWRRHRGPLTRLVFAVTVLLLTICGTLMWRASQYQSVAEQLEQKQQELFRAAFPGQRVPAAILGRLRSEHAKAMGVRKMDDSKSAPQSVLRILPSIIESLAVDFPFELKEVRIENGKISLELELASQEDAGRVAAALARNGFVVEPPATTLINGDHILASYVASMDRSSEPSVFAGEKIQ